MKGVFFSAELPELCEIRDVDTPEPDADEILVKNVAVASNPKDWKLPLWMKDWQAIEGNDVAGYVEAVGSQVSEFKKGDRVAGFSKMKTADKYGAYAEYTVVPGHTSWKLGHSTSFEDAVTLPLAVMTACIGLFIHLGLSTPATSNTSSAQREGEIVLINGASSSVGAFAVQLATRAGYSVIGISGQSSSYARSLGADYVVDYRNKSDGQMGEAIAEALASLNGGNGKIVGVYDAVSTEKTVEMLATQALQKHANDNGRTITTVLPAHEDGEGLSVSNVRVIRTMVGTAHAEHAEFAKKWYRQIGSWLDDGSFKPNQVKLMPHGLDSVKEGIHLLKAGKVNAQKLVYRISDSQCLQ